MNAFVLSRALEHVAVALLPIVLGMMCHEIAHGWVAVKMGDPTPRQLGRLTFNPLVHLDPLGSFCFLFTAVSSSVTGVPFIFGWAKPVPISPRRFRRLRSGLILVSLAGAAANLILAFMFTLFFLLLFRVLGHPSLVQPGEGFALQVCRYGIFINCTLAWFNLLPIPPLDGSKVLACLLPSSLARPYMALERYGMLMVLLLMAAGFLGRIIHPLTALTVDLFLGIVSRFF
jgi:Zn-dependent protease